jgi:hypothetical protein
MREIFMTDDVDTTTGDNEELLGEWDDSPSETPLDELVAFLLIGRTSIKDGPDGEPEIDTGDLNSEEIAELAKLVPGFKDMLTEQVAKATKH